MTADLLGRRPDGPWRGDGRCHPPHRGAPATSMIFPPSVSTSVSWKETSWAAVASWTLRTRWSVAAVSASWPSCARRASVRRIAGTRQPPSGVRVHGRTGTGMCAAAALPRCGCGQARRGGAGRHHRPTSAGRRPRRRPRPAAPENRVKDIAQFFSAFPATACEALGQPSETRNVEQHQTALDYSMSDLDLGRGPRVQEPRHVRRLQAIGVCCVPGNASPHA
jgi:hypothetical protein